MSIRAIPDLQAPRPLIPGDTIRFVSPASTPDRGEVEEGAEILRGWGFNVDFGPNAFNKLNYLAGTDDERLSDFNAALTEPNVRAIFATRGGKGSYRIADKLDFAAARRDPKFVVGFSDITALHLALCRAGVGGAIHGALTGDPRDWQCDENGASLRDLLLGTGPVVVRALANEPTSRLTTTGRAVGPLIGGNLDMLATCAGWALPSLGGCIVLIEAVNMWLGQVDRQLTMLRKGGHFEGIAGIALGQFTDFKPSGALTILDLLEEHLGPLGVPILGGLPLGHGAGARCVPIGPRSVIDTAAGTLSLIRDDTNHS